MHYKQYDSKIAGDGHADVPKPPKQMQNYN